MRSQCEAAMRGIYSVVVSDNHVRFKFELARNITIVRGDSGTGITILPELFFRERGGMFFGRGKFVHLSMACTE